MAIEDRQQVDAGQLLNKQPAVSTPEVPPNPPDGLSSSTQSVVSSPQFPEVSGTIGGNGTNAELQYKGADISDTALQNAQQEYFKYNPVQFLDKVKSRLQEKFKPETEVLGLSSFASQLGPLDPNGVIKGIADKQRQFARKGDLALQAMSTGNEIYSGQAKRAYENMTMLQDLRSEYEQNQNDAQKELHNLALEMVKTGQEVPNEILSLLPTEYKDIYNQLAESYKINNDYINNLGYTDGVSRMPLTPYGSTKESNVLLNIKGLVGGKAAKIAANGRIRPQYGQTGWECAEFAEQLVDLGTPGNTVGNSYESKKDKVDKYGMTVAEVAKSGGFKVGDVVLSDGSDVSASGSPIKWGHVFVVADFDDKGNMIIVEANRRGDGKITNDRVLSPNDPSIYGIWRGTYKPVVTNQL